MFGLPSRTMFYLPLLAGLATPRRQPAAGHSEIVAVSVVIREKMDGDNRLLVPMGAFWAAGSSSEVF
jgi:hypothetical protein